jgi:hypothetical protein
MTARLIRHSLFLMIVMNAATAFAGPPTFPAAYNITWASPSSDSLDSMPLSGSQGAGANVWVQDGSLWLYLAHNGAYDEQGRLLKLGCLRITPVGANLGREADFSQQLELATGSIVIRSRAGGASWSARLWFDHQTLFIETESTAEVANEVCFATWRDVQRSDVLLDMGRHAHTVTADTVVAHDGGFLVHHRNADHDSDLHRSAARHGVAPECVPDVVSKRTFGVAIAVEGGLPPATKSAVQWQHWVGSAWTARTAPRARTLIVARLAGGLNEDPTLWRSEADAALARDSLATRREAELRRWADFWSRSYVIINPNAPETDPGFLIGRNYQLFRYMLACNRDGELPLLFNGGIFTTDNIPGRITGNNNDELKIAVDPRDAPTTPDYRRWMYCHFMSQNQRWLGYPALAGGDADLVGPSMAFYRDRAPVAAARAKTLKAEGVVYPEPMDVLGLNCVHVRPDGLCGAVHLTYHFSMMLEHALMTLEAHDILGTPIDNHLDWISGTVLFYDSYYRAQHLARTGQELSADHKLVLYPANAVEYAVDATNPIDAVAGLTRVTERLLALPNLPEPLRSRLTAIQATIPPLPTGMRDGKRSLLPAESFGKCYNRWEPVEHYAAFPYRLVGVTQPETLQLARDTWDTIPEERAVLCKQDYSWMPNLVNMAILGWTERAEQRAVYKMANNAAPQARFPAFFGPGHDWLPDHNWGGSGMTGIQEMLLSHDPTTGKLIVLPAWPKHWDVTLKLHSARQTTVRASVINGAVKELEVEPAFRRADVHIGSLP